MPPDIELFDEDELGNWEPYTPRMTEVQKYLWESFEEDLAGAEKYAGGAPVVVIVNGDVTHGLKYPYELVSTRAADQITIAVGYMKRVMELPNVIAVRLVIGTGAHELGEGTSPILVARELRTLYPSVDIRTLNHGLLKISGVRADVAHHGPSKGIRNWLRGNVLYLYGLSIVQDHIDMGKEPPRVIVRGHRHEYVHRVITKLTPEKEYITDIFILPSYSGMTSHARQGAQSPYLLGNGLLATTCEGGEMVDYEAFWRVVDLRTEEEL